MVTYTVKAISEVAPELLRDLRFDGKTHAVIRHNEESGSARAWSFHSTERAAVAAKRRWMSRDIVTR